MSNTTVLEKKPSTYGDFFDMVVERDGVKFRVLVGACTINELGEQAAVERAADVELEGQRQFAAKFGAKGYDSDFGLIEMPKADEEALAEFNAERRAQPEPPPAWVATAEALEEAPPALARIDKIGRY